MINLSKIPLLSFFTGAGFLDLGFLKNGFEILWHNEFHKPFIKAFETGMTSCGYSGRSASVQNSHSIVELGPNAIIQEAFIGQTKPEVFGIIGGPPCPDFSVGGKNMGNKGDQGRLSEVYVNRIIELNPTFFVFENVPGLLRTENIGYSCTNLSRNYKLVIFWILECLTHWILEYHKTVNVF